MGTQVAGLIAVIESNAVISESNVVSYAGSSRFDFLGIKLVAHHWGDAEHVSRSYWGTDNRTARSSVGEPKLIDEMKQAATCEGWDFDSVCTIAEGEGFPDVRSNPARDPRVATELLRYEPGLGGTIGTSTALEARC